MKKNIYYMIKSVKDYCLTFSCCCNAGFASLFWSNMFAKKLFFYGTLFLLVFGQASLYSQAISGAAVKANFGIDADVYANRLQFGGLSTATFPNTDDWFLNIANWPGSSGSSGFGVIDVDFVAHPLAIPGNGAPTLAQLKTFLQSTAGKNFPFERRMSQPKGTTVNNYLWLDAVYGRDGIATQGYVDATVFTKTTDKNGQDPTTWNLGTGGTPAKNDIVDVYAHLRGEGPRTPTPDNPRPFTTLWGFGGATTISADGNSHNDFEFFRTDVTFDGSKLINTGTDEGHTAWTFLADGKPNKPGDILISVDFENGGTKPLGSVRIWMKKTDVVVATFNSNATHPNRFFDITGVFDGTSGATYGYAEIAQKGSVPSAPGAVNTDIFAVVNTTADTFGAPWGSLEGQNTKYFEDIKQLQFSEFGINLTAFGLDKATDQSTACASLLGTLIVKTRSSSSFTAELKDFAGPYQFGNAVQPSVNLAASPAISCTVATATITASGVVPSGATVTFYGPDPTPLVKTDTDGPVIPVQAGVPILQRVLTPGTNIDTANGTYVYTAVASAAGFQGCEAKAYVNVVVNKVPPVAAFSAAPVCLGTATSFNNTSSGASLTYSWNFGDGSPASTDTNPTHTYATDGTFNVTLTVTSGSGGTGCTASVSHNAVVNLIPVPPSVTYNPPACDETTFSITITGVTSGAIYTVKDKNGSAISGLSPASPFTAPNANNITFSNIPAGSGYQVSVVSVNGCASGTSSCASSTPTPIPGGKIAAAPKEAMINDETQKAGFDAYPVPFKDMLTVKYNFDYKSDVKIEVFNSQGNLVLSKLDSNSYLDKEVSLDLKFNKGKEQVYVVKLTTNRGSSTKKVISSR